MLIRVIGYILLDNDIKQISDIAEFEFCKLKRGNLCKFQTDMIENLLKRNDEVLIEKVKE